MSDVPQTIERQVGNYREAGPYFANRPVYTTDGIKYYSYGYVHQWIRKLYGRAYKCVGEQCTGISGAYQWANISGKYLMDITDWKQLCRSCHSKFDFTPDSSKKMRLSALGNTNKRVAVKQYDLDGNYIKTYPSLEIASIETGTRRTSISLVITGVQRTAGGYKWRRASRISAKIQRQRKAEAMQRLFGMGGEK